MKDRDFWEKFCIFCFSLSLPSLCVCLILDGFSHYKVYQLYKSYPDKYVIHDLCFYYETKYFCSDNYTVSEL